ncbi:glycosyltransferase family 4 protein [Flavobacterium psychraquaticum]|uniref:glycosyltransferase family 4 protein n=1 Tax=Flavobacterium psychraquaticum TaxID=3103958 RepID=UPI002ACE4D9D|nr:glycosyltransferase family 4 protein [Flavobacterium sp. LB-N7T]
MTKVILISQIPLPYSKIGSWSTIYDNYLKTENEVDIIICPYTNNQYQDKKYFFLKNNGSLISRILKKLKLQLPWHQTITTLKKAIQSESNYIIHIIDNFGLCMALSSYLEKKGIRDNFYIHYFYHGFPFFKNEQLYSKVDELTLLTYKSYESIKKNVNTFPCRISILHNGIDTSKFYSLSTLEKQDLKKSFQLNHKTIFVWCSQDRPKKGLHIILDAWQKVYAKYSNVELLIIGTAKKQDSPGISYLGRIPNSNLARYYQMADVYLFSTLCQEGFPLSLTEALHCGCYCIASALGGVPEVLEYGKYGKLIENPNFIDEWVIAIENYLKGDHENLPIPKELYSKEVWNKNMNQLIQNTKENFK